MSEIHRDLTPEEQKLWIYKLLLNGSASLLFAICGLGVVIGLAHFGFSLSGALRGLHFTSVTLAIPACALVFLVLMFGALRFKERRLNYSLKMLAMVIWIIWGIQEIEKLPFP